jgi:hypothetical protein
MGVRPELVRASSKAEQDRVMGLVRAVQPLSLRFPEINVNSAADLRRLFGLPSPPIRHKMMRRPRAFVPGQTSWLLGCPLAKT